MDKGYISSFKGKIRFSKSWVILSIFGVILATAMVFQITTSSSTEVSEIGQFGPPTQASSQPKSESGDLAKSSTTSQPTSKASPEAHSQAEWIQKAMLDSLVGKFAFSEGIEARDQKIPGFELSVDSSRAFSDFQIHPITLGMAEGVLQSRLHPREIQGYAVDWSNPTDPRIMLLEIDFEAQNDRDLEMSLSVNQFIEKFSSIVDQKKIQSLKSRTKGNEQVVIQSARIQIFQDEPPQVSLQLAVRSQSGMQRAFAWLDRAVQVLSLEQAEAGAELSRRWLIGNPSMQLTLHARRI